MKIHSNIVFPINTSEIDMRSGMSSVISFGVDRPTCQTFIDEDDKNTVMFWNNSWLTVAIIQ